MAIRKPIAVSGSGQAERQQGEADRVDRHDLENEQDHRGWPAEHALGPRTASEDLVAGRRRQAGNQQDQAADEHHAAQRRPGLATEEEQADAEAGQQPADE